MGRAAALLGGVALALGVSAAWAQDAAQDAVPGEAAAETAAETAGAGAATLAPAGTFLAARAAVLASDFPAAAGLLAEALLSDPDDGWLLDSALLANLGLGRVDEAAGVARLLVEEGFRSPFAHLALQVDRAAAGDWRGVLGELERGRSVGALVDGLSRGWAWQGLGEPEAALGAFDELATVPGLRAFGLYHKALALALGGDLAAADAILGDEGAQPTRRAVLAHAEVLSALGRNPEAVALLEEAFGPDPDRALLDLRARLEAGERLPFTFVASAAEGLAEAYLNVAGALGEEEAPTALLYARAALALDPERSEAALLAATLLQALGQPALARDALGLVPEGDPSFVAAELGRAALLRGELEEEAALEVLNRLAEDAPDRAEVRSALGDLLRATGRDEEAEGAYDAAIRLAGPGARSLWVLHFTRALAREAQGDWPGTEEDLRRALALAPDQPQVLNHLGYSLVERGESLEEALALLERAVALRPDSGAIVDSLGWAFFKLGRHAEAVAELERAATLLPTDPVINDHLGDAYWRVGREREARFQWSRALSLEPEPEDAEAIRRKLVEGLVAEGEAETAAIAAGSEDG